MIAEERASILEVFDGLTAEQWDVPTLCADWTVRQMLAHLILAADPPFGRYTAEIVRARGSFDLANERIAADEAQRPTDELIARYRERIGTRYAPPVLGPSAPLTDVLLHSLDVRIPLGLPTDAPPERYAPALALLLSRKRVLGFVRRGRPSLRWVATDRAWSMGGGDEVHGTMADLTLAASGRAARIQALTGPGRPALAAWLHR